MSSIGSLGGGLVELFFFHFAEIVSHVLYLGFILQNGFGKVLLGAVLEFSPLHHLLVSVVVYSPLGHLTRSLGLSLARLVGLSLLFKCNWLFTGGKTAQTRCTFMNFGNA